MQLRIMKRMMWASTLLVWTILASSTWAQETITLQFSGTISDTSYYQLYDVDVPRDGMLLTVEMQLPTEQQDTSDLDTLLYLLDSDSRIVAQNDDASRGANFSRIQYPEATTGSYKIVATRYDVEDGDSVGDYVINATVADPVEVADPFTLFTDSELAQAGFPDIQDAPRAIYTVLVYYGADNNLEPAILRDLDEFEVAGGSNASVRVVALVDNQKATPNNDWTTARLFEVNRDTSGDQRLVYPPTIDSPSLRDLGEINTSSANWYARFLVWGIRNFPAQNYIVTVGSHGAGWHGLVTDDTDSVRLGRKVILTLPQLERSYEVALREAGVERFNLLINDACLMSSVEYHIAMSQYFDYSVASPEIVVNPAHDMTLLLNTLKTNSSIPIEELGKKLITGYMQRDVLARGSSDSVFLTSALTDLRQYATVETALERFTRVFATDPAFNTSALSEARQQTYVYSAYVDGQELIDLGNYMRLIVRLSDNPLLILAAQDVLRALQRVTIYAEGGSFVSGEVSNYQNIFFPEKTGAYVDNASRYFSETALGRWGAMLRSYFTELTPNLFVVEDATSVQFHPPSLPVVNAFGIFPPQEALDAKGAALSMRTSVVVPSEIIGRNLNAGYLTFEKVERDATGAPIFVRYSEELVTTTLASGVGQILSGWDVTLPYVNFAEAGNFELLRLSGIASDGSRVASMEGRYRTDAASAWNDVSILFDATDYRIGGTFLRVVNRSLETGAVADVDIPVGAEFQTIRYVVRDGKVSLEDGNAYRWIEGGPVWEWRPAPSGDYNITTLVTTSGGETSFSQEATVDNTDANIETRADALSIAHMSVSRPREWTPFDIVSLPGDYLVFRSSDPTAARNATIYFRFFDRYQDKTRDGFVLTNDTPLEEALRLFTVNEGADVDLGYNKLRLSKEPRPLIVDGKQALEVEYSYVESGVITTGKGYLLYHDSDFGRIAYLIAAEASIVRPANYELLRDQTLFWDYETSDVETPQWRNEPQFGTDAYLADEALAPLIAQMQYLVPVSYSAGTLEEINGVQWVTFTSDGGAGATHMRFRATLGSLPTTTAFLRETLAQTAGEGARVIETRRYPNKYFTWDVLIYALQQTTYGRIYTTTATLDGQDYGLTVWVDTPYSTVAQTRLTVAQELEPLLDSLRAGG